MRSDRDLWLIALGLIALAAESLYLAHQMRWLEISFLSQRGQTQLRPVGKIIEKRESVKQRSRSSLSWYPVSGGDLLYFNDTLMTQKDSTARVWLEGGTEIFIEPNSLINFTEQNEKVSQSVVELQVNQGAVKVKTVERAIRLRVRQKEVLLEKGADVRLSRTAFGEKTEIQVLEGKAQVKEGSSHEVLQSLKILKREPAFVPLAPLASAKHFLKEAREKTVFRWEGEEMDLLEVSSSKDFKAVQKVAVHGKSAELELGEGRFFWRVRSGEWVGSVSEFVNFPLAQYKLLSPVAGKILRKEMPIKFQWGELTGASQYRFELSREPDFQRVLFTKELSKHELLLRIKPGKYYWRVHGKYKDLGYWPGSEPHSFSVIEPLKAPKPKGFKILEERSMLHLFFDWVIPSAQAEGKKKPVKFEWEPITGAKEYAFELGGDPTLQVIQATERVTVNEITLQLDPTKTWYWRVAGVDVHGEKGAFCAPQKTEPLKPEPSPTPPAVIVVEKKVKQLPKATLPWRAEFEIGNSGIFHKEVLEGGDFKARSKGVFWTRLQTMISFFQEGRRMELGAIFHPWTLGSEDENISAFQGGQRGRALEGTFLLVGFANAFDIPLSFGLNMGSRTTFTRTGSENLDRKDYFFTEGLIGTAFSSALSPKTILNGDIHLVLGPIGEVKSLGLRSRLRLGYRYFWRTFFPELFLSPELTRTSVSGASGAGYRVQLVCGILAGWRFE